jgi:hypothetical protein
MRRVAMSQLMCVGAEWLLACHRLRCGRPMKSLGMAEKTAKRLPVPRLTRDYAPGVAAAVDPASGVTSG